MCLRLLFFSGLDMFFFLLVLFIDASLLFFFYSAPLPLSLLLRFSFSIFMGPYPFYHGLLSFFVLLFERFRLFLCPVVKFVWSMFGGPSSSDLRCCPVFFPLFCLALCCSLPTSEPN